MAVCSGGMCHIPSGDRTSERYSIAFAVLGNNTHMVTHTQAQPSLSGAAWLLGLRAEQLSAEAPIILDSIIKCHVITRYGVMLSLPASPPGCCSPSDRYGGVCACMRVSACMC